MDQALIPLVTMLVPRVAPAQVEMTVALPPRRTADLRVWMAAPIRQTAAMMVAPQRMPTAVLLVEAEMMVA
jgi:hypothetical protein